MSASNRELTAAERWIGGALIVASIALTVHSLFRMCVMRTSASKLFLFPIVNTLLLACELVTALYVGLNAAHRSNMSTKWMQAGKKLSLALVTTIILYLAYMRCRAIFLPYRRYPWAHYALLATCGAVLMAAFAADAAAIAGCGGNVDDPRCLAVRVIDRVKEWAVPVMRFYYIISEGIFFVVLFRTLWKREDGENPKALDRLLRLTTIMFTFDLVLLTAVSVYRIVSLFRPLPDYELVELFSIAITVFNMTEFGLSIPKLFRPVQHASSRTTAHRSVVIVPSSSRSDDDSGSTSEEASDRVTTIPMHAKSYSSSHAPLTSCLSVHAGSSHRYSRSSDYEGNRLTQFDAHTRAFDHGGRDECHVHQADKSTGTANLSNSTSNHDTFIRHSSHHNLPLSDDNICGLGEDIRPSSSIYSREV